MSAWARLLAHNPLKVLIACLLVLAAATVWGLGIFDRLTNGGFEDPEAESSRIITEAKKHFGDTNPDLVVLYKNHHGSINDPAVLSKVQRDIQAIPSSEYTQVVPWYATKDSPLVNQDGTAGMVLITLAGADEDAKLVNYQAIVDQLQVDGLETHVSGMYPMFDEINTLATNSIYKTEIIAIPVVFLLSIAIFGSLVAALMPTIVGVAAIVGSFALLRMVGYIADVNVFAVNVVTILGMGLAIDYALFLVTRFREEMRAHPDKGRSAASAAAITAMQTAGRTVLFSGLTVAVSLASLLIFPQPFLKSIALGGMAAVLVAMLATLTLLPAVLVLLGRHIDKGAIGFINRAQARAEEQGGWAKLAGVVMRRPLAFIVPIVALLALLSLPFFNVHWGSVDAALLPKDSKTVIATDKQEEWFGTRGAQADILLTGARAIDQSTVQNYLTKLKAVEGVQSATVVNQTKPGTDPATMIQVQWDGLPQSPASQDLLRDIRAVDAPAPALVGGQTAATVDLLHSLGTRLPAMFAIMAGAMFVLLFLAFGSVVLPIKALVMNILSLGASFGVVTWIFADGHLEGLLGFTSPGYLDITEPLLMLAILFGLSMDYEVFLLSRVKEEYDKTGDNTRAVAAGLQRTGRLITSAALLLSVVIVGFAASPLVNLKMIGVGMLVAIALDATVVRALLVPATMRLLGRWNWYAPPGLRWVAERFSIKH